LKFFLRILSAKAVHFFSPTIFFWFQLSFRAGSSFFKKSGGIMEDKKESWLTISDAFNFYDLNSNGVIEREELQRYFKCDKVVDGIIERLDKNRDGVISYTEFYSEVSKIKDGEATLMRYLERFPLVTSSVVPPSDKNVRKISLQNREVPLSWATNLEENMVEKIFRFGPFMDWIESINKIDNSDPSKPELVVDKIHIQHIDMFGPRIGFLKFEVAARKWNQKMNQVAFVPGIVFMRGGAVGILCILIEAETGDEYALITLQPRIPAGYSDFAEIPAGMLDGEPDNQKFAGKAAKEMNEETLLEIKESELYDLTNLAYGAKYKGMYPSAGGCDEFLKLFLYRRIMGHEAMEALRKVNAGDGASEIIKLKLVPLDDLWQEAPDAKALSALYLYERFKRMKIDHPPTPRDAEQEQLLKILLEPKIRKIPLHKANTTF
jgi:ADP-sugar diphosphatase